MIKRIIDLLVSFIGLLVLSPVLIIICCYVKKNLGSPVFFSQERAGLKGKTFKIIKFRTMKDLVDETGKPLPDGKRLTAFGSFLRRTSLDEMPGLLNVLKGDMSLVGPRPLLVEYLPLYNKEQTRRHNVKPGVTGWAQINGRNAISWEEKFKLDIWYVENQSTTLDIKIILLTILKVFKRENITADSHATMPKFRGTSKNEE